MNFLTLPLEVHHRILHHLGLDDLHSRFRIARTCRKGWEVIENGPRYESRLTFTAIGAHFRIHRIVDWVHRIDSEETMKLLFSTAHVPEVDLSDREVVWTISGLKTPVLRMRLNENFSSSEMEMLKRLLPVEGYQLLSIVDSVPTPEFLDFAEKWVKKLVISTNNELSHWLECKHKMWTISLESPDEDQMDECIDRFIAEWMDHKREIISIAVTRPWSRVHQNRRHQLRDYRRADGKMVVFSADNNFRWLEGFEAE